MTTHPQSRRGLTCHPRCHGSQGWHVSCSVALCVSSGSTRCNAPIDCTQFNTRCRAVKEGGGPRPASTYTESMQCERLETAFMSVHATERFFFERFIRV